MVAASAHDCASAYVYPHSGSAPSGLPRWRSVGPSAHYVSLNSAGAPFSLPPFASLTGVRLYAHSRSVGRGYFRSFLTPITHVQPSLPFASTSLSLGRILPRSSVGLASLALGTIGLILRHDCVCACDFFSKFLNFFLKLGDRHFIFEIAWLCPGYARVLSE